jgi:LysR family transcriptional regulator, cyn operon transcriptional activator
MTLQQLEYFLAAASHRSFSSAAQALHMAQPSLSEQIRRLEAELGSPLFIRGRRGLELTEAGRLLQPHAERTLAAAQEAGDSVREVRELAAGTATFGTFGNAPYYLLSDLVQDFRSRYPNVRVRLIGQNSSEVADAVRDGQFEAGLIVLPIDDRGLDIRPAIADELLYLSADPERVLEPMTIERLAEAPLILYDARFGWSDPTRRQLAERAQAAGVRLDVTIEVEAPEIAFDLAARGYGHTVATRTIAGNRRFPSTLRAVEFEPTMVDTFALITRRGAHVSPATRVVLRAAERHLDGLRRRMEAVA